MNNSMSRMEKLLVEMRNNQLQTPSLDESTHPYTMSPLISLQYIKQLVKTYPYNKPWVDIWPYKKIIISVYKVSLQLFYKLSDVLGGKFVISNEQYWVDVWTHFLLYCMDVWTHCLLHWMDMWTHCLQYWMDMWTHCPLYWMDMWTSPHIFTQ
jgi:hypothetical protein